MPSTIPAAVRRLPNPATDATLLDRFAADRDEPAFAELVRRHGQLVLGVCKRLAGADAEDAFQAVFLVLSRKAASVSRPEQLANYLYGVAVRVGRRARRSAGRRRERTMPRLPDIVAPSPPDTELAEQIDAALCRLPDRLRTAVILCEIQGLSRTEAATRLGIPEGTLSSRLADARKRLATLLSGQVILAGLTVPVSIALTNRAVAVATGELVSVAVLALATGETTMRTVTLAITTLTLAGLTAIAGAIPTDKPADPPGKPVAKADVPKEPAVSPVKPKLGRFLDLPGTADRIEWTADGKNVVVVKRVSEVISDANAPNGQRRSYRESIVMVDATLAEKVLEVRFLPQEKYLAISPDGERLLVIRRDSARISGVHRLEVWERRKSNAADRRSGAEPAQIGFVNVPWRTLDIDTDETVGGRFTGNGQGLVIYRSRPVNGQHTDVRLSEVAWAADGTTKETELLKLAGQYLHVGLNPYRPELLTLDAAATWEWHPAAAGRPDMKVSLAFEVKNDYRNPDGRPTFSSAFSPDGTQAVVSEINRGVAVRSFVLYRTEKGLQIGYVGSADVATLGTYSANGKLFCAVVQAPVGERPGSDTGALTVWQMADYKTTPVKRWGGPAISAFSPTKPVLAIAETLDRSTTRLGFWDFTPPAGK